MRASLLFKPAIILKRLALYLRRHSRRRPLRSTPAAALSLGHLDSLELLQLLSCQPPASVHDIGANADTWTCTWPGDIRLHRIARSFRLHALGANLEPRAPFAQADALFLRSA